MQKNKSFQKPNKNSKQYSNFSSKALLELSQITAHSKEKSSISQNFTDRSANQPLSNLQNSLNQQSYKKPKQNPKPQSKKQNYVRKNISLSNTVLKQIMEISESVPVNGLSFSSTRIKQNDNDLIILSKKDLQKGKGNSQTKKSRKLLLYENKQNQEKFMSKSKSSYGQALKGQGILCSIKIHPVQEQKGNQNFVNQKRDSFDARRSSFSSRRSSIRLFPQDDFSSQSKIREIKKSFLAKIAAEDPITQKKPIVNENTDGFLKKSNEEMIMNKSEQRKPKISKQTCQNDTQVTPYERKQMKQKYLFKLDELSIIEEDIKKDAFKFITIWDAIIESQRNLRKYQKYYGDVKKKYQELEYQQKLLKNLLYEENKKYLMAKRMSSNNTNIYKQSILLEAQRIHNEVKKKVFKKELQEMMIFNMKVVLPSSEMMESSISCFDNRRNVNMSFSNITILQLYEELINQKACKKYGMILKKEINNMNIYDSRTMNEYLRRLYELQVCFHKIPISDFQNQSEYLDRIQNLVEKIEETGNEFNRVKRDFDELEKKIRQNESLRVKSKSQQEILLNQMSENIFSEYKIFQTGGKYQTPNKIISSDADINQSFCENDKTIDQFRQLVTKKYETLFNSYKQLTEEKKLVQDSLKNL